MRVRVQMLVCMRDASSLITSYDVFFFFSLALFHCLALSLLLELVVGAAVG